MSFLEYGAKGLVIRMLLVKYGLPESALFDNKACAKCGGRCCKASACGLAPWDFEEADMTEEFVETLLDTGAYMIALGYDFWGNRGNWHYGGFPDNIQPRPYLCMREEGMDEICVNPIRNKCIFLGTRGCKLKPEDRPSGGLLLIPSLGCENLMGMPFDIWRAYQHIFENIVQKRKGRSIQGLNEEAWLKAKEQILTKIHAGQKLSEGEKPVFHTLHVYGQIPIKEYLSAMT